MKKNTDVEQALMKELRELKARPPQAQNLPTQQPMRQTPQCSTCQQSGNRGFSTIASGLGVVVIMCASVLLSLADALLQNSRETVRGHAHGTGSDRP